MDFIIELYNTSAADIRSIIFINNAKYSCLVLFKMSTEEDSINVAKMQKKKKPRTKN